MILVIVYTQQSGYKKTKKKNTPKHPGLVVGLMENNEGDTHNSKNEPLTSIAYFSLSFPQKENKTKQMK
jgi:hypothetical protein